MEGLIFDADNATEKAKRLYSMLVQAVGAMDQQHITEEEKKLITMSIKKSKQVLNESFEEQKKQKANETKMKHIEKLRLTVSSNLAEKETASAQLRTEHTNCRFELQMCQANLEKLITLCRSITVETHQILNENKQLERESINNRDNWNDSTHKLAQLMEKMDSLCKVSPRLNAASRVHQVINDLRSRLHELEEQRSAFLERQQYMSERLNSNGPIVKKMCRSLAAQLLKVINFIDKFKEHVEEKREFFKQDADRRANKQIMDMSIADFDNTQTIIIAGDHIEEEMSHPVEAEPQIEPIVVPPTSPRAAIITNTETAPLSDPDEISVAPLEEDIPVETSLVDEEEPVINEQTEQLDVEAETNIDTDTVFGANAVLNISQNSNDPGGDFLAMMQTGEGENDRGTGTGEFSFNLNFDGVPGVSNDGDGGFDFNFDSSATAGQEASFGFNFDANASQGESNGDFFNFGF